MGDKEVKKPLLRRIYDEIYEFAEAVVLISSSIVRGLWRDSKQKGRLHSRMFMILVYLAVTILAMLLFDSAK